MPIRVKCENCKKTLSVKDHLAGKKIKCPVCQSVVVVSAAAPAKEPAAAEPAKPAKPAATKAGTATKPVKSAKPATEKPATNGTPAPVKPANGTAKSNGTAPPPAAAPEPAALPPENLEAEALSAFADDPKPAEEDLGPPQTIDVTCPWCDEAHKMPLDMGGKQAPCPNPECKRIIKIPLPKIVEKKDWRKLEKHRGPIGAILNQPEVLDDAWGTVEATKARQASLEQAGAVERPPKPGIGVYGWIGRGIYAACALGVLIGVFLVASKMMRTNEQVHAIREINDLLRSEPPKITEPILVAEAYRTLGLLHLQANNAQIKTAKDRFQSAAGSASVKPDGVEMSVHEQMFIIELALTQIELGGTGDDTLSKNRLEWNNTSEEVYNTLKNVSPEVQLFAVREVTTRLLEKNQPTIAAALASRFANQDKRPLVASQQIALLFLKDDKSGLTTLLPPKFPEPEKIKDFNEFNDGVLRIGFAEGFARKGNFAEALAIAQMRGPAKDRFEALLGVATIGLSDKKNKDEAAKAVKEALAIAKDRATPPLTPWQQLQLIRLVARTEDSAKEMLAPLPLPFKMRAHLEILQAQCDNSDAILTTDALPLIQAGEDKEGITLALAWLKLTRHNASRGADRKQNRAMFEHYLKVNPPPNPELLRPLVDIGTYQGLRR